MVFINNLFIKGFIWVFNHFNCFFFSKVSIKLLNLLEIFGFKVRFCFDDYKT